MARWPENYPNGVLIYPMRFMAEILLVNRYTLVYFNGTLAYQIIWV